MATLFMARLCSAAAPGGKPREKRPRFGRTRVAGGSHGEVTAQVPGRVGATPGLAGEQEREIELAAIERRIERQGLAVGGLRLAHAAEIVEGDGERVARGGVAGQSVVAARAWRSASAKRRSPSARLARFRCAMARASNAAAPVAVEAAASSSWSRASSLRPASARICARRTCRRRETSGALSAGVGGHRRDWQGLEPVEPAAGVASDRGAQLLLDDPLHEAIAGIGGEDRVEGLFGAGNVAAVPLRVDRPQLLVERDAIPRIVARAALAAIADALRFAAPGPER